jgi:hypothetical protein
MWDLQRNGGNVVATTERILSGRGLEVVSATGILCPGAAWKPLAQKYYIQYLVCLDLNLMLTTCIV